ncbi:MAG: polysaccharide biosynthesis/export family protein [Ferruginibacter sp.]
MIKKYYLPLLVRTNSNIGLLIILPLFLFTSCKVYQPTYYFKDINRDTVITGFVHPDLELKIQKNDILSLSISSLSPTEDILFNSGLATESKGLRVDLDGNIYMHKLGKMAVTGMTRQQLKLKLENELLPFLKDPVVTVNFVNHKVTVFGEASSTVVDMPDEKMPILEVMARTNAMTPNSELNHVLVIRETPGAKEFKHLNLEDPSIFTSPWYYLQPNDIVVMKPNEEKIATEARRTRNQLLYTTVLSAITFVFLIVDRIFR